MLSDLVRPIGTVGLPVEDMIGVSNSANESIDDDLLYSTPRILPVLAGARCVTPFDDEDDTLLPEAEFGPEVEALAVDVGRPRLLSVERFRDKTGMVFLFFSLLLLLLLVLLEYDPCC